MQQRRNLARYIRGNRAPPIVWTGPAQARRVQREPAREFRPRANLRGSRLSRRPRPSSTSAEWHPGPMWDFTGFDNEYSSNFFAGQHPSLFQGVFRDTGAETASAFVDRLRDFVGYLGLTREALINSIVTYETQRRDAVEALSSAPSDSAAADDLDEAEDMLEKLLLALALKVSDDLERQLGAFEGFSSRVSAVKSIAVAKVREFLRRPEWTTPT